MPLLHRSGIQPVRKEIRMKHAKKLFSATIIFFICLWSASAEQREIIFPIDGEISSAYTPVAFTADGRLGFAIAFGKEPASPKLFSFSVSEGKVIDTFDLAPDFGVIQGTAAPLTTLRLVNQTSTLTVWGVDSNNIQKIANLSFNKDGQMRKLWLKVFPPDPFLENFEAQVAFNLDASRIYYLHYDVDGLQNLALLDSTTGEALSRLNLPGNDSGLSVLFNKVRNQAIALSGNYLYAIKPDEDRLEIDFAIQPSLNLVGGGGQFISHNGRFLVTYGGFSLDNPPNTKTYYASYDLESKSAQEFFVAGKFAALSQNLTAHKNSDSLFVPLQVRVKNTEKVFKLISSGSRLTDIITLSANGALSRTSTIEIPEQSADDSSLNLIYFVNNIVISKSGVMGFVAAGNGRIFTFDTLTGEIVNDQKVANRLFYISLIESQGLIACTNGSNKLILADVSTTPIISSIQVKKKQTIIKGANFLSGAKLKINGVDIGIANRNPEKPGNEITLERGKKDFPAEQEFTFIITNRDDKESKPFTYKR